MKKRMIAAAMIALLLTGCGSTPAGNSVDNTENLTNSSETAAASEQAAKPEEMTISEAEHGDEELGELLGYPYTNLEIPYPKRLKRTNKDVWATETPIECEGKYDPNRVVCLEGTYDFLDEGEEAPQSLDELLEKTFIRDTRRFIEAGFDVTVNGTYSDDPFSAYTIESKTQEDILGYQALRVSGTISAHVNITEEMPVHFTAHYTITQDGNGKDVPMFWIAFAISNDENVLDEMNYIADLPLTKATLHE